MVLFDSVILFTRLLTALRDSVHLSAMRDPEEKEPDVGWFVSLMTYYCFAVIIMLGHARDFFAKITRRSRYLSKMPEKGYSVLFKSWESFYTRRLYHRIQDCWNRPISSSPGAQIVVMERISKDNNCTLEKTGGSIPCLNLGSYNYLGFADDWKDTCKTAVIETLNKWPINLCTPRLELGTSTLHKELESIVSLFIGKDDALVYSMGYGTNTSTISVLMGEGCLLVSDDLNHLSIVNGARASGAQIRVFRHNDPVHLEEILREAVVNGQPRHFRPWRKIMVIVEGIYSMEGNICNLKAIVAACKKHRAYIYVDEAHSIGALGHTGRGICEHAGVDPKDIDILMGTFTKSFSGMGGYIAASKEITDFLRLSSAGQLYHNAMSPILCSQIIQAFKVIMGEDGTGAGRRKIDNLMNNSNYFRSEMKRLGLHVLGHNDSPIIPVMIYMPGKIAEFSRECLKRGIAIVVVGFPATSAVKSRARFCISAALTRKDIEKAVAVLDEVTDLLCLKYGRSFIGI